MGNLIDTDALNKKIWGADEKESLRDKLREYSKKRADEGLVTDTSKRATFLISESTLENFDAIVNFMEATNGVDRSYKNEDSSITKLRKDRMLAKGFKSKSLNLALDNFITEWKQQNETPNEVYKTTYKASSGKNHRVFMFTLDGATYGIEQDERSNEVVYMSTDEDYTKQDIEEWYNNQKLIGMRQRSETKN